MFVLKLKPISLISILLLFTFLAGFVIYVSAKPVGNNFVPNSKYCVVIDAGHGGIDGGSVGKYTGVNESELNLTYAKTLKKTLNEMNINCVLTRSTSAGLYDKNASSLKKSEMQNRKNVIDKVCPDLVVSIHMNSFPIESVKGAQVFYKKDSSEGEILANDVQNQLNTINFSKKSAKVGDYFMVNCTNLPSVLVECGYLSNKDEELLLQQKSYQEKFCYLLACGIVDYFNK